MDNADIVERFFAFCKGLLASCWAIISEYIDATHQAEFDVDYVGAFALVIIIMFFVGSACWAASIAASRRYLQIPHFILGLLFPWIYPVIILFAMDIKGHRKMMKAAAKAQREKEAAEAERQKNIALNSNAQPEEAVDDNGFNQTKFMTLYRNVDGTNPGPWNVVFSGNKMRVTKILEVLPEMVSVSVQGEDGNVFTMRIPYAKMESWENA